MQYPQKEKTFSLSFEIVVAIFDHLGKIIKTHADTVHGTFTPEQLEEARQHGYRYTKRLKLTPGLYQIRVGVRDVNGERIGTSISWIEVPDLRRKKLALSSLFLGKEENEPKEVGTTVRKTADQPALVSGRGSFRRDEPIYYRFVVYGVPRAPLDGTAAGFLTKLEIIKSGAQVYDSDRHPLASRTIREDCHGIESGGQLKMDFEPGFYTLRVTVKNPKSRQENQTIDFELEP